jgi:hypothetical protein
MSQEIIAAKTVDIQTDQLLMNGASTKWIKITANLGSDIVKTGGIEVFYSKSLDGNMNTITFRFTDAFPMQFTGHIGAFFALNAVPAEWRPAVNVMHHISVGLTLGTNPRVDRTIMVGIFPGTSYISFAPLSNPKWWDNDFIHCENQTHTFSYPARTTFQ